MPSLNNKRAPCRIAGNGVSCYTQQAGRCDVWKKKRERGIVVEIKKRG
jgi:hydroxylamine reductase (hybrid-cluster protein)